MDETSGSNPFASKFDSPGAILNDYPIFGLVTMFHDICPYDDTEETLLAAAFDQWRERNPEYFEVLNQVAGLVAQAWLENRAEVNPPAYALAFLRGVCAEIQEMIG